MMLMRVKTLKLGPKTKTVSKKMQFHRVNGSGDSTLWVCRQMTPFTYK